MFLFLIGILFALGAIESASVDEGNSDGYKSYKNYKIFRVSGDQRILDNFAYFINEYEDSIRSTDSGSIYVKKSKEFVKVLIAPELLHIYEEVVTAENLTSILEISDFSEVIKKEQSGNKSSGFSWTAYYDIDVINDWLKDMSKAHPKVATVVVAGKSYEGRQIIGLKIVTSDPNGNKKPVVYIESGIHAREWITPATTTYFINELLTSKDPDILQLRDSFEWHIFPSVNPDGYHYSHTKDRQWRKTMIPVDNGCTGVDGNRNFDYNWGVYGSSTNPCSDTYAGPKPFSTPETTAMANYLKSLGTILAYLDFHSEARSLLIPFSNTTEPINNQKDLLAIGKLSLKFGEEASGLEPYRGPGPASYVLYSVSGCSMDWAVDRLKIPLGFIYELRGEGHFYWPPDKIPLQGVEVTQMIRGLFVKAKELGYY